jgi:putative YpdA family bacillithiol system oxidoreductase
VKQEEQTAKKIERGKTLHAATSSEGTLIYDLLVVGGGPAGLSTAVHAKKEGLTVLVVEKGELANTVFDYQKNKHVMSEPSMFPLRSDIPFEAGPREKILGYWHDTVEKYQVPIHRPVIIKEIIKKDSVFEVTSDKALYHARRVVLAIGIQGNPNRLGKPGEDLPHVSYKLTDPSIYEDQDIMMVGAGDAAIEGVLALCEKNRVTVINRNTEFFRLKDSLERQINQKIKTKKVVAYHNATIERFEPGYAFVTLPNRVVMIKTDFVFIRIGASLPRPFLEKCGATFPSTDRTALPVISEHYESAVAGLYIIGDAAGSNLIKQGMNQGYEVVEHILGRAIEPVEEPLLKEKLKFLPGTTDERLQFIAKVIPLMAQVQKQSFRELILEATVHHVKPGQVIYRENDFSDSLYMILQGKVAVTFSTQRPEDQPITLQCGAFFGEMSLLSGRCRSGTVTSIGSSTLIEVPRKAMLRLIASEPAIKRFLDKTFSIRALRSLLSMSLEERAVEGLARKAQIKAFSKDEVIVKQREVGDSFYLVRSGSVKISKRHGDKETVVKHLPAGEYFGEMALLDQQDPTRKATVTATTRTEVMQLMKDDFHTMLVHYPAFGHRLREEMQRRLIHGQAVQMMPSEERALIPRMIQEGVFEGTDVLFIDENKCVRCDNCVKACAATHDGQTALYRNEGTIFGNLHVPNSCRHCENPLCLTDCPAGDAIQRGAKGEVYINEAKCIGCGNCASNCPYNMIVMSHSKPKVSAWTGVLDLIGIDRKSANVPEIRTKAIKCDLCRDDSAGPACVRSCPTGAAIRVSPAKYFETIASTLH